MKLSIVSTLYCSAPHLEEFCERVVASAKAEVGDDFELILVNDHSPDSSLEVAQELGKKYPQLVIVDLSRNFGHYKAVMTGLSYSKGDHVYLLDSDLEEDPEWLSPFLADLHEEKIDVVFGVQKSRQGGVFNRFSGWLFWRTYETMTGYNLPRSQVTARVMTRRYVNALIEHRERVFTMGVLFYLTGFEQKAVPVDKKCLSESTYTFRKKVSAAVSGVVMVSSRPLVFVFFLGLATLLISLLGSCYWVIHWFLKEPPPGWVTLVISVWALGGLNISCVGMVGIYLAKVFEETKQRPYSIVKETYRYDTTET